MSVFQDIQEPSGQGEAEAEELEYEDLPLICDIILSTDELEDEEVEGEDDEKKDKMPDLQKNDTLQINDQSIYALRRGNTIFPDVHWNTATYQQRNQLRLISLLSYETGFRKTNQIDAITGLTQDIAFFKNLQDPELHRRCAQCMKYESFPAGSMIFRIGSIGWKFYIIIEGTVGVYLRSIQDSSGNVVSTVVHPSEKYGNLVGGLQYLKQLSTGDSFGELALMERRPRQASIVAHTDLYLGVIEKNDFQLILRTHEENKQQQMARFFDRIPPFSKWNFRRQVSLHLNSIRQEFKINQIVYRQGAEVSAFYIIKSGTFAVK